MNFGELIETYSRWNFTQNTFFGKIRVLFSLEKYSVDEILELFKYLSNRSPIWRNFRPKMARYWVFLREIDWNLTEFAKVPILFGNLSSIINVTHSPGKINFTKKCSKHTTYCTVLVLLNESLKSWFDKIFFHKSNFFIFMYKLCTVWKFIVIKNSVKLTFWPCRN